MSEIYYNNNYGGPSTNDFPGQNASAPYNPNSLNVTGYGHEGYGGRSKKSKSCDCSALSDMSKTTKIILIATVVAVILTLIISLSVVYGSSDSNNSGSSYSGTINIMIQSSNTKEAWLDTVIEQFHNEKPLLTYNNKKIKVSVEHTGSTFHPELEPTIWSPANSQFIRLQGTADNNDEQYYVTDEDEYCYPVTDIPVGMAMWRPYAEALGWPDSDISFEQIGRLALNDSGWASVDSSLSAYGNFKFGHGHPDSSNSGRLSFVSMIYAFGLNDSSLLLDEDFIDVAVTDEDVIAITQAVEHLGKIDTDLLARMRDHGPSYLHAVANYESNVVLWNKRYRSELANWGSTFDGTDWNWVFIYFSDGTFWMTHPLCVLDGDGASDWVSNEQIGAAQVFAEYATNATQLEGLLRYGVRPAETSGIDDLECCNSSITEDNGADPTKGLESIALLQYPEDDVMTYAIKTWHTIKKPAAFALVIDTSGSMNSDGRLTAAKTAVINFINSTDNQDWLYLTGFSNVGAYSKKGNKSEIGDGAMQWVSTLTASLTTPIYEYIQNAWSELDSLKTSNEAKGIEWNYGIVAMTDGEASNTDKPNYYDFFEAPYYYENTAEDANNPDIIHIFPIIFGDDDAETDNFNTLASVSGGKFFQGDNEDLTDIYYQLSLEL